MCALRIKKVIEKRNKSQTIITNIPTQPVDKYLQRFSHFSQIGLLALGAFGYFYTVQPIYQNQQLQEQSSKLELEKSALEKNIKELKHERAQVEIEIQKLISERDGEKIFNTQLLNDMKQLRTQEETAKNKIKTTKKALESEQKNLDQARWKLILDNLSISYLFESFNAPNNKADIESTEYFLGEEEVWTNYYIEFMNSLEERKKEFQNKYPESYFIEIRSFFIQRKEVLQCEKPDFQLINEKYQKEIEDIASQVEIESEKEFQKLRDESYARGHKILITEDFQKSTQRGIRLYKIFTINKKYDRMVRDKKDKCRDKILDAISEFRRIKNLKD